MYEYDREMDKIRAANRDALIAVHEDIYQQSKGLQMENTRLQGQIDVLSLDSIKVTTERHATASKEAVLAVEVNEVKSKLQAALTTAHESRDGGIALIFVKSACLLSPCLQLPEENLHLIFLW